MEPPLPVTLPHAKGSVVLFFALCYAISWACWITVVRVAGAASILGTALLYLGTFSPAIVALALTALAEGRAGVNALLARLARADVGLRWYAFAALYFVSIKLAAALILRVATGAWPRFGTTPLVLIPFAVLISWPVQAGEEIGWRGFALPRMGARMGLAPASLVLGALWALWHLPLFYLRGADTYGQSFIVYALSVVGISVAMAWLFANTGGSLLLPMLLHSAVNNTKDVVPSAVAGEPGVWSTHASAMGWIAMALLWICGAAFLAQMARRWPPFRDAGPPPSGS